MSYHHPSRTLGSPSPVAFWFSEKKVPKLLDTGSERTFSLSPALLSILRVGREWLTPASCYPGSVSPGFWLVGSGQWELPVGDEEEEEPFPASSWRVQLQLLHDGPAVVLLLPDDPSLYLEVRSPPCFAPCSEAVVASHCS